MKQTNSSAFALLVSAWMLLEGGWGFFHANVLGILTTNRGTAVAYLVLGILGLLSRRKAHLLHRYLCLFGSLLIMVSFMWVLPATRNLPVDILDLNGAGALLNFVIGVASLVVAVIEDSTRRVLPKKPAPAPSRDE